MENAIVIGIKKSMVEKGLYQKSVAKRAGFTEQQFSDMLNGRKVIRADYIPAIEKAIDIPIADLFSAGRSSA